MRRCLFLPFFLISLVAAASPDSVLRDNEGGRVFYLTFDSHNDPRLLDHYLAVLARYRVRGTFFITGYFITHYPDAVRSIVAGGHLVANHSLNHKRILSVPQLHHELQETERLFHALTGQRMAKLWRAPYLQHLGRKWQPAAAREIGYRHIDVTIGVTDWFDRPSGHYLANEKFLRVFTNHLDLDRHKRVHFNGFNVRRYEGTNSNLSGGILLMHCGRFRGEERDFAYALEPIVRHLLASGYRIATLEKFEDGVPGALGGSAVVPLVSGEEGGPSGPDCRLPVLLAAVVLAGVVFLRRGPFRCKAAPLPEDGE